MNKAKTKIMILFIENAETDTSNIRVGTVVSLGGEASKGARRSSEVIVMFCILL